MKQKISPLKQQDGSVLLLAVMILMLLTVIGISATTTTNIELQISGNDKAHKIAFYNADSGIYTVPRVISQAINDKATPNIGITSAFTYVDTGDNDDGSNGPTFYRELAGLDAYDTTADLNFSVDPSNSIGIDVERIRAVTLYGGGAEFASASGGAGVSIKGIYFGLDSFGSGPNNAQANIGAQYLKVLNVAGGM